MSFMISEALGIVLDEALVHALVTQLHVVVLVEGLVLVLVDLRGLHSV